MKRIKPLIFLYHIEEEQNIPTRHPIDPGWRAEAMYGSDGRRLLQSATYSSRESALLDIKCQLQQLGIEDSAAAFTMGPNQA